MPSMQQLEARQVRCKSPGKARCQLNYPRTEQVVDVNVLEKVKAARQEVLQQCDVMGVSGPQWRNSSQVTDNKYTTAASDEHLSNRLLARNFIASDVRKTKTRETYDKQRCHAFTRGDVTTGWNHSTELIKQQQCKWQQQLDSEAKETTLKRTQRLGKTITLVERQNVLAQSLRATKEAAATQEAAFVKQYGPEGAAAMRLIMTMSVPDRKPITIKAKKEDLLAVQNLPAMGLVEP
eukprot:GHRR01000843.1.p1 GENE.GHRR01000843.1~~GHRR01000843.1.p1  ORF type:complete len:236 (+),score=76.96 GHRR01000843.1:1770-2477(+)